MKQPILIATTLAAGLSLIGCSQQPVQPASAQPSDREIQQQINAAVDKRMQAIEAEQAKSAQPEQKMYQVPRSAVEPELIKVSGVGYGAESTYEGFTDGQRRLMAIRSAKLDAYRSLAEQLNGIKIDSNTTIATLTARNDSFRARVNSMVRGARVVSVTPMADQNYETVLEVYIDRSFFEKAFVYSSNEEKLSMTTEELCDQINCNALSRKR
ncbi:MAG: LPP20 family lipoprotein [Hydrogenovibrio sp.]|uniref:LPP20 family lipoprotein n=1 Tax=Hydrogenovibrio sp. TaxID=2065821 RepID=UPI0028706BF5|nr:LPP20 family lipoprotein [Hydrogenovibrio sp.]MDR9499338.1 LPP20 family lipoprotein [Hydrogenovibrio sp.]